MKKKAKKTDIVFKLPPHSYEHVISTLSQKNGWGIKQNKIPSTWSVTKGEGMTAMVIDTGYSDHMDLGENSVEGKSFVPNESVKDGEGHACISPESVVFTDEYGLLTIEEVYNKVEEKEFDIDIEDCFGFCKDVSKLNIKTASVDMDGNTNKNLISKMYKTYVNSDIYKINITKNTEFKLTPWHKIPVKRGGIVQKIRADELRIGDSLLLPNYKNFFESNYYVCKGKDVYVCENCGHVVNKCKERNTRTQCKKCNKSKWGLTNTTHIIDEDMAYFIGLVLTDGCITNNKHQYRVEITSETTELVDAAKNIIKSHNFGNPKIDIYDNLIRFRVDSKDLVYMLINLGILDKNKTYDQDLPLFLTKSPYSVVCAFLSGVIDGDGCINKQNTKNRITGVSYKFINKLSNLFNLIGVGSLITKEKNFGYDKVVENKQYPVLNCIFSSLPTEFINHIRHPEKKKRLERVVKTNRYKRIQKIEKEKYVGFMYDFTVENDNTYFANGSFVSNTHCCGIIAAQDNGMGMVGVAPKAKVIGTKALGNDGSGSNDWVANALDYAIKVKPDVVSMSLGSPSNSTKIHNRIKKLYDMDIPVICAAGNAGKRGVDYPGAYDETIAVAAYDKNGNIANFSAVGEQVDFAAPGVSIYSTYLNNDYAVLNGTSMACPFITGVVLLLLAKHRKQEDETGENDCTTVEEIKQHLLKYTVDKGYVGKDKYFGYGVVDVEKMLLAQADPTLELPKSKESVFRKIWVAIRNAWWRLFEKPA